MTDSRDMEPASPSGMSATTVGDDEQELDIDTRKVGNLFNALHQTLRASQLYGLPNPATQRQLETLKTHFRDAWEDLPELDVLVQETTFSIGNNVVYRSTSRKESLSFVFYKDGIRQLTFRPGFEDKELIEFVEILQKAFFLHSEEDDLVTLLWKQDFSLVRYLYVEADAEEVILPDDPADQHGGFVRALARNMNESAPEVDPSQKAETVAAPAGDPSALPDSAARVYSKADLLLDPDEVAYLGEELDRELHRNVRQDVVNALLDCLEEPSPTTQTEILEILRDLVPYLVLQGHLKIVATTLQELRSISLQQDLLGKDQQQELEYIFDATSTSSVIDQLLGTLEAGHLNQTGEELEDFLGHLGPGALESLIRAVSRTGRKELRTALDSAILSGATRHPKALLEALKSQDALVVRGAVRLVGRQGRTDAVSRLAPLFKHRETSVRLATVEASVTLGGQTVLLGIREALADPDRDVRIAAAWGVGTWQDSESLSSLRQIIEDSVFRKANLTEKIAMLDAYARVGGDEAVPQLNTILNGRSFFRQVHLSDMRACAARALALIGTPTARTALEKASHDRDVTVRRAVVRALRKVE